MKETLECTGKFILRVTFGGMMLVHGWQKLSGFNEMADKFPDPLGIGSQASLISTIGAEVVCAVMLILGLLTRFASLPLAFTMIVALFIVHGNDPWQKKELAAVYLAAFAAIFFLGAGRFSLDNLISGRKKLIVEKVDET